MQSHDIAAGVLATVLCQAAIGSGSSRVIEPYVGDWPDHAPRLQKLGDLRISATEISVKNMKTYTIFSTKKFGDGELFEVKSLDRRPDPLGCGHHKTVTYIAIKPIKVDATEHHQAMKIIFYGGDAPPESSSISEDPFVCSIFSYWRRQPDQSPRS